MKKRFIFLVMLFALLGGVNWNVLNAQEPGIKIGEDKQDATPTGMYPMYGSWYCSISQQIFTAAEIGVGAGNITSIAFKTSTAAKDHNITVWLLNTTNSTLDSPMAFGNSDKVFDGEWNSGAADTWSQITLDRAFSYNGDNLVVILQENGTGSTDKFYKYTKGAGKTLQYKYASYVASLEGLSGYTTSEYNNVFGLTIESAVDEGLIPGTPANLTASVIDHVSVSLTWEEGENAQAYNVYKNGVFFKKVKTNSCIVDGLNPETTYEFTVTTLNFDRESDPSNVATATTPAAPKTRTIVFALGDPGYGDGWNSNTMTISYGTYSEDLTLENGSYVEYEREIPVGAEVTLTYTGRYYASENDFEIRYKDGDVIWQMGKGSLSNTTFTKYFTVEGTEPSVVASENSIALGTVRVGNYWTEKTQVSETFNITAKYTTITEVSCNNTFFDVAYDGTSVVTVGYNKTADVTGEQTGIITIKADGVEDVTVEVSATAYTPVTPDVIELVQEVEFTAGAYENTPDFATLHDDYILPGEATEGSTPDAVYRLNLESGSLLTVNVTGTNAVAAIYKKNFEGEEGPMADNNFGGIVESTKANEVIIGEETTSFTGEFPNNELYDYSISQQIYTAEEMQGITGTINSIAFKQADATSITRNLSVYLLHTNKTSMANWVNMNSSDLVFAGDVAYPAQDGGWIEIELQKPFEYTGGNIMLCLVDNTGNWIQSAVPFYVYNTNEVRTIAYRRDNNPYDPTNITTYGATYAQAPTIKFGGEFTVGASRNRSTEPQINTVQYPAGEYYLVAAAEDAFTVSIETGALPVPDEFAYTAPTDGAKEQNNPVLTWEAAQYATEYKVYLGTSSTLTEENLAATVTTPSYQTEGLSNNTQYFWRVDAVNETGTQEGAVYSFITPLNQATELAVTDTDAELYPGETTTLTWTAAEGALSYNVYLNDTVKLNETAIEETSFELTNLPHNVNPGNAITVTAVHTLGESAHSEAIYVKMAGEFNLVVNVKDAEGNAIENAAVAFNTESNGYAYYDEYFQLVPAIETLYTDAEGKATKTMAMPCVYSSPNWTYSYLEIVISKEYATSQSFGISAYTEGLSAGQDYVKDITLEYVAPQNPQADKYYYVEGEDMVLTWNKVEGAVGYNVYKVGYSNEIEDYVYTLVNEEAITDTTFTVENLKYDLESLYVTYAVTADYGFVESAKAIVYAGVTGKGQIAVTVTDGTNPIKGATVTLVGPDGFDRTQTYTFVTNEEGKFTGDMLIGSYYTATVSHYDYNEKVMEEDVAIEYQTELSLDIVLEAKQEVEFEVTAAESGDYVNVTWEAAEGATSYNVYRRDSEGNVQRIYSNVTSLTATDYYWSTLEAGTYEYGVSAKIEQVGLNITEDFEDGIPSTWAVYNLRNNPTSGYNWTTKDNHNGIQSYEGTYAAYAKSSTYGTEGQDHFYLVTDLIDLTTVNNPQLSFAYYTPGYYGGNQYCNTLKVKILTESDGQTSATNQTNHIWSNNKTHTNSWQVTTVDLTAYIGQKVYVAFENFPYYGYCSSIDFIKITSQGNSSESKVNWSNEVVREAYATFNNAAGDNDWSNKANWSTEAVPTEGENVIIAANANLNTVANVAKIRINGSATLTLNDGAELTVTGTITQLYDSYTYSSGKLVINDGAQLFQSNENVYATFNMNIVNPSSWSDSNTDGWQFIASPFNSSSITNFVGLSWAPKSYDLYKYEGNAESGLEWNNHKDGNFEEAFVNGRGYLASYETLTTATLSGNLYNKDNFEFTEVSYTEGKELANFHLLGNPFSFDMDWSNITVDNVYAAFATVDPLTGGYVNSIESGVTTIPVGDGFFVEAIGENPSISYNAGSKSRGEKVEYINVVASGKQGSNNVIIKLSGKEEKGFSKLENLNQSIADIYVKNNGRQYSVLGYDNDVKEVEFFFDAKEMGNYTISLDVNGEFETVTLVDRFTGVKTNMLLEDEYTFTATSNDNVNRFVIRLANGQEPTANSQFVYQSGEELILSIEGTVQIVDMLGRVVYYNEHANGDNRINVAEFNDAAYVVRVVNEEGVKSQKVVIY